MASNSDNELQSKPKSFEDFFNAKRQAKAQAKAEAEARQANLSTLGEGGDEDLDAIAHGFGTDDVHDINSDKYRGNIIAWGKGGGLVGKGKDSMEAEAEAKRLDEERQAAKENMPWTEKYRPEKLEDVISHESILSTLDSLIQKGALPHVLFYGPAGSGKTSTALALARKLNAGESASSVKRMVLELNASDERGIETVREKIKDFASSKQLFQDGTKLVILDEADSMTRTAQFALRRIIEKYTKTTRFCIIANYVNKIIPALQSRCTSFRFGPLDDDAIATHLTKIAAKENLPLDEEGKGLRAVIKLSGGDMRKCLNIMQACKAAFGRLDEQSVYNCTGAPAPQIVRSICADLLNLSFKEAFERTQTLQIEAGLSLVNLIESLHELVCRIDFPPKTLAFLLDQFARIEKALSVGASEKLQLAALVSAFVVARQSAQKEAKVALAAGAGTGAAAGTTSSPTGANRM